MPAVSTARSASFLGIRCVPGAISIGPFSGVIGNRPKGFPADLNEALRKMFSENAEALLLDLDNLFLNHHHSPCVADQSGKTTHLNATAATSAPSRSLTVAAPIGAARVSKRISDTLEYF